MNNENIESQTTKVEIIGSVKTSTDNPWRTQGDYRQDQKRQTNLYYMQAITLVIAVAGLLLSSYFQYQTSKTNNLLKSECSASSHQ